MKARGGREVVVRRAAPLALLAALAISLLLTLMGRLPAAFVLTMTALTATISTLCLEGALVRILQPGRPRFSRAALVLLLVHFGLWALFLVALYQWRRHLDLWAAAVGLGCLLLGIMLAGVAGQAAREG